MPKAGYPGLWLSQPLPVSQGRPCATSSCALGFAADAAVRVCDAVCPRPPKAGDTESEAFRRPPPGRGGGPGIPWPL